MFTRGADVTITVSPYREYATPVALGASVVRWPRAVNNSDALLLDAGPGRKWSTRLVIHAMLCYVYMTNAVSNSVRSPIVPTLCIPGISHVLAVASGKGGVGKTTVAVNLALALRQNGVRVGVFDADLYGPNILPLLGVQRKLSTSKPLNIPVVRTDRSPYIPPLERFGLQAMSLGLVLGDTDTIMADGRFAGRMICQTLQDILWGELDILVLDFPPGTGEPQQTLLKTIHIDGV